MVRGHTRAEALPDRTGGTVIILNLRSFFRMWEPHFKDPLLALVSG